MQPLRVASSASSRPLTDTSNRGPTWALALVAFVLATATSAAGCEDSCETLGDSAASDATPTVLRIVNTSPTAIFLEPETPCSEAPFKLEVSDDGGLLDTDEYFCGGDATCQAIADPGFAGSCEACPEPPVRMIPSGATFETTWDGMHFVPNQIPASCNDDDGEKTIDCVDRRASTAGTHRVPVRAFSSCEFMGQPCECQPTDPDGTCALNEVLAYQAPDALSGEMIREVAFNLPGSGVVTLTFDGI